MAEDGQPNKRKINATKELSKAPTQRPGSQHGHHEDHNDLQRSSQFESPQKSENHGRKTRTRTTFSTPSQKNSTRERISVSKSQHSNTCTQHQDTPLDAAQLSPALSIESLKSGSTESLNPSVREGILQEYSGNSTRHEQRVPNLPEMTLVGAGFFLGGLTDVKFICCYQCAFRKLSPVYNVSDIVQEHEECSTRCEHVQRQRQRTSTLNRCRYPDFADEAIRRNSFHSFQTEYEANTDAMAMAGLFYADDMIIPLIRCYCCGKSWIDYYPGLMQEHVECSLNFIHIQNAQSAHISFNSEPRYPQYTDEAKRQASFTKFPADIHVSTLAADVDINSLAADVDVNTLAADVHTNTVAADPHVNTLAANVRVYNLAAGCFCDLE